MSDDYVLACADGHIVIGSSYTECVQIAATGGWAPLAFYGVCRVDLTVDRFGTNPENWA